MVGAKESYYFTKGCVKTTVGDSYGQSARFEVSEGSYDGSRLQGTSCTYVMLGDVSWAAQTAFDICFFDNKTSMSIGRVMLSQ